MVVKKKTLPKIKWMVEEVATGMYKSFFERGWPTAEYPNQNLCAMIICDDEYVPRNVKSGDHKPLRLKIVDHSKKPWGCATIGMFKTLKGAKAALTLILEKNSHLLPEYYR